MDGDIILQAIPSINGDIQLSGDTAPQSNYRVYLIT